MSLDWGFHPPLMVLTENPRLIEPFWHFRPGGRPDRGWHHRGDAGHVYLVHEPPYDRFGHGLDFLAQVAGLPPGVAETRAYRDREGAVAFLAIRLNRPHRLFVSRPAPAQRALNRASRPIFLRLFCGTRRRADPVGAGER